MVVYLDLAFFLNSAADALALYVTARLAGLPVRRLRILAAAVLGGAYGAACLLPPLAPAAGFLPQAAVAAGLTLLAFGRRGPFLRRFLLFYLLCCTLGGAMTALSQLLTPYGGLGTLAQLNWKVFFLVSASCYILLSLAFRGGARHALAGELRRCELRRGDRRAELTALLDTGHTLTDPASWRRWRNRGRPGAWSGCQPAHRGSSACCPTRRWGSRTVCSCASGRTAGRWAARSWGR